MTRERGTHGDPPSSDAGPDGSGSMDERAGNVSRRDALKVLGAVPLAAAIGTPALAPRQGHPEAPTQPKQPVAPRFFSAHEWRTVRLLVDYVIPRDERSGSATDAKVPEYMDFLLSEKDANENTKLAIRGGLAWLDNESRRRFQKTFVDSTDAQRKQLLDDIAWPKKAAPEMKYGVAFFSRFRDMTASGFFSSAAGWQDLKYMGHTFVPVWNGCPPEALEKLGVTYDLMTSRIAPQSK
jgi:Gluconate 2-dehydrogenase subunit 3